MSSPFVFGEITQLQVVGLGTEVTGAITGDSGSVLQHETVDALRIAMLPSKLKQQGAMFGNELGKIILETLSNATTPRSSFVVDPMKEYQASDVDNEESDQD